MESYHSSCSSSPSPTVFVEVDISSSAAAQALGPCHQGGTEMPDGDMGEDEQHHASSASSPLLTASGDTHGELDSLRSDVDVVIDMEEDGDGCDCPHLPWAQIFRGAGVLLFGSKIVALALPGVPSWVPDTMELAGCAGFEASATTHTVSHWSHSDNAERIINLVDMAANGGLVTSSIASYFPPAVPAATCLKVASLALLSLTILSRTGYQTVKQLRDEGRLTRADIVKLMSGLGLGASVGGFSGVVCAASRGMLSQKAALASMTALLGLFGISAAGVDIAQGVCGPSCLDEVALMEEGGNQTEDESRSLLGDQSAGGGYGGLGSTHPGGIVHQDSYHVESDD